MRIFAISDLHLSYGVDKPMDVFGPQWVGHGERIREAWDAMVSDDDWVLVGGDTSWGLNLREAQPDLDWLGARPGRKVLIKGNHCTWWVGMARLRQVLHESIVPLHCNAVKLDDGTVVVGTRLWDPPDASWAEPGAQKIFTRELERLKLSIAEGHKLRGERLLALIHYPPRYSDGRATEAVPLLEAAGVRVCVYGHLHGESHALGFQGDAGGIRYLLTACDAIDFRPIEVAWPL
ncbi:MAG: metallophosphoesterase [Planctomycetes bacterium]|nr:metallophosphoesterase [Planctomycetota bacterium]